MHVQGEEDLTTTADKLDAWLDFLVAANRQVIAGIPFLCSTR